MEYGKDNSNLTTSHGCKMTTHHSCWHLVYVLCHVSRVLVLWHLYVAMFALYTWLLYKANMANAGTIGKPSVARTTRQYRQYHWG